MEELLGDWGVGLCQCAGCAVSSAEALGEVGGMNGRGGVEIKFGGRGGEGLSVGVRRSRQAPHKTQTLTKP